MGLAYLWNFGVHVAALRNKLLKIVLNDFFYKQDKRQSD